MRPIINKPNRYTYVPDQPTAAPEETKAPVVDSLVVSAKRKDRASRSKLCEKLSDICLASGRHLTEREQELFFEILRSLIHRIEVRVRKSLAEQLAVRPDAPHDLIIKLARDRIEVAYPILVKSAVLDDADLIELVIDKAQSHREAIAQRAEVSASVTNTLVETGDEKVISTLLRNQGATFMPHTFSRLVDDSLEITQYQELLLQRSDCTPELAKRMYRWVGEAMRDFILDNYDVSSDTLDEAVENAISEATDTDMFDDDYLDLSEYAAVPQYETESANLLQALSENDIYRFEEIFGELSLLDSSSVTRLLYDSGSEALAISFKAIGVERDAFGEIFCFLRGSRPYESFMQSRQYEQAMDHYDNISRKAAEKILVSWRRAPADPDLQNA